MRSYGEFGSGFSGEKKFSGGAANMDVANRIRRQCRFGQNGI
jgi:hypothetical protein